MDFIVVPSKTKDRLIEVIIPVDKIHCVIIHEVAVGPCIVIEISSGTSVEGLTERVPIDEEKMSVDQFKDLLRMVGGRENNTH